MSNARKLQTEIDRVMKKVDEGVELFDEIWEKVYSAEQQNQKEKHEMDLKKEIKKLQRLRDQIKSWISSSDVKDKDSLIDARKLIETKMEAFKVIEKETKTKTYSKEGLARAERLSPEDEAKQKTTQWISETIEHLNQLVEDRDVEIERLSAGKGKKTNKNSIEEYNEYITNHKFHISKLEGIMRLVNNDLLQSEAVDEIKEELEYYIEAYEDDDYMQAYDEDMFYETLGLEELDVVNVDTVTQPPASTKKDKPNGGGGGSSSGSHHHDNDDADSTRSSNTGKSGKNSRKNATSLNVIPLTIGRARVSSDKSEKGTPTKIGRATSDAPSQVTLVSANSSGVRREQSVGSSAPPALVPAPSKVPPSAAAANSGASMAAILKREGEQQEKERQAKVAAAAAAAEQQRQAEQLRLQQEQQRMQQETLRQQEALRQAEALKRQQQLEQQQRQEEALKLQHQQQQQQQQQQQLRQQQEAAAKKQSSNAASNQSQAVSSAISLGSATGSGTGTDLLTQGLGGLTLGGGANGKDSPKRVASPQTTVQQQSQPQSQARLLGTLLSGDPSGQNHYIASLGDSMRHVPTLKDTERQKSPAARSPYPTNASYPTSVAPANLFDNPAMFEKLGTDCLFFIFYYNQGTYQQYLAARELKKQSWRFHKKYMTWFQRHEEPKITTDEYEQGTYVYFDYETGWCQRLKEDFRFEYSFLEDSLSI